MRPSLILVRYKHNLLPLHMLLIQDPRTSETHQNATPHMLNDG
jgi:hypothetical protein